MSDIRSTAYTNKFAAISRNIPVLMGSKSMEFICDAKTLSETLGPHFLLLVGSAVPGANTPRLPMVPDVLSSVLNLTAQRLQQGSYTDRLLSAYALSLVSDRYNTILRTTKFEEFLWRIQAVAGRIALDDLLTRLYVCNLDEYGPNQNAIRILLERRRCTACLTTNFDNSIECSYPDLLIYHHPNYPESFPAPNQPAYLLKLHGDAKARNCVATSPALSDAKRLAQYQYLKSFLTNQTILVLGYSGFGDVDITPHLASSDARFVWGIRDRHSRVPEFVNSCLVTDLASSDPSRNLLLGLASQYGWQYSGEGQVHRWQENLASWCDNLDIKAFRDLIMSIFEWQAGWPLIHIYHIASSTKDIAVRPFDIGEACLQVSAYASAERHFKEAQAVSIDSLSDRIKVGKQVGFTQWRQGNLDESLDTFSRVLDSMKEPLSNEERIELSEALRIYLEVCRDWLYFHNKIQDRQNFFERKGLSQVLERLESLPQLNARSSTLARIIILDIRRLMGNQVNPEIVQDILDESRNLMLWQVAEQVARVLIKISFRSGFKALLRVDWELAKRGNWNLVRKSIAAILYSLLGGRFPIILSLIDGPLLMKWKTPQVEWRYYRKRKRWDDYMQQGKVLVT